MDLLCIADWSCMAVAENLSKKCTMLFLKTRRSCGFNAGQYNYGQRPGAAKTKQNKNHQPRLYRKFLYYIFLSPILLFHHPLFCSSFYHFTWTFASSCISQMTLQQLPTIDLWRNQYLLYQKAYLKAQLAQKYSMTIWLTMQLR